MVTAQWTRDNCILYLTTGCFDKGGVSRYSRYQIRALRELFGEHSVRTMSLLGPAVGDLETPFKVDWCGGTRLVDKIRFAGECLRVVIRGRPRVIHAAHLHLAPLAVRTAKLIGATTVLNVYGREVWSRMSRSRERAMRAVDCMIADCHFTSNYVAEHGIRLSPPVVLWDCVDLDRFSPGAPSIDVLQRYGIPCGEEQFVIMTLGRLSRWAEHKGYERLLKVFSIVSSKCPRCRLIIAGTGDRSDYLKGLARELRMGDRIMFTGSIDEHDLPDVYRAATVFSLVSDRGEGRGEGIPLTPLEALACGVPVIVGNQDGSQEAVIGGRNGVVCDPSNLNEQVEILVRLYENPAIVASMRGEARKAALENFGYDRFRKRFKELYMDLRS